MRQEMRKLNRAKYACSDEEVKRLTAEGYVPVGRQAAPDRQDTEQQAAAGKKDKKPKKQAAEPDQEDDKAGQQAADEDGNKK